MPLHAPGLPWLRGKALMTHGSTLVRTDGNITLNDILAGDRLLVLTQGQERPYEIVGSSELDLEIRTPFMGQTGSYDIAVDRNVTTRTGAKTLRDMAEILASLERRDGGGGGGGQVTGGFVTASEGVTYNHAVVLDGGPASFISTPNSSRFAVSGDPSAAMYMDNAAGAHARTISTQANDLDEAFAIRARVSPEDWMVGYEENAIQPIVSRWRTSGNNRSWLFRLNAGRPELVVSPNGSATTTYTAATGMGELGTKNGAALWLAVSFVSDNGDGASEVIFYTSDNGNEWHELGAPVTAAVLTPSTSSAFLEVGSGGNEGGLDLLRGKIWEVRVYEGLGLGGVGAVLRHHFRAADSINVTGTGRWTSSSGEAWQLYGGARIVADIAIRAKILPQSWDFEEDIDLLGRHDGGNVYDFRVVLRSGSPSGNPDTNFWMEDFATFVQEGVAKWISLSLMIDDGDGRSRVSFHVSSDGITWQHVNDNYGAALIGLPASELPLTIGQIFDASGFAGRVYALQMYDGLGEDGLGNLLMVELNAEDGALVKGTWESTTTGETWTLQGGAELAPDARRLLVDWVATAMQNEARMATEVGLSGASGRRPTGVKPGTSYFDTSLGRPIWWSGSSWVDATGSSV